MPFGVQEQPEPSVRQLGDVPPADLSQRVHPTAGLVQQGQERPVAPPLKAAGGGRGSDDGPYLNRRRGRTTTPPRYPARQPVSTTNPLGHAAQRCDDRFLRLRAQQW